MSDQLNVDLLKYHFCSYYASFVAFLVNYLSKQVMTCKQIVQTINEVQPSNANR